MKALTICQSYSHLIVTPQAELPPRIEQKRVENRNWNCHYRGPLLIHAGQSRKFLNLGSGGKVDLLYRIRVADMAFGAFVGIADVVDCISEARIRDGDFDQNRFPWLKNHSHVEGAYCIILQNSQRFEKPIPYRGQQGLFNVTAPEVMKAIHDNLTGEAINH